MALPDIFQGSHMFYLANPEIKTIKKNGGERWDVKKEFKITLPVALQGHLDGTSNRGVVLPPIRKSDNKCLYGAIDIDGNIYKDDKLKKEILSKIKETPLVACFSKSKGLHLIIRFHDWTNADKVIEVLRTFLHKLGLPADTEIFPKQSKVKDTGNGIMLPFMKGIGNDWIKSYDDNSFTTGTKEEFEKFVLTKAVNAEDIKIELPPTVKANGAKDPTKSTEYTKFEIIKKLKDKTIEACPGIGGHYHNWIIVVIAKCVKEGYGDNEILDLIERVHENDRSSEYTHPESYQTMIDYTRKENKFNKPNPGDTAFLDDEDEEDTEEQKEFMSNIVFNMKDDVFHNIKTGREYTGSSIKKQYQHIWKKNVISEFEHRGPPEKQMVEMSVYRPDLYKPDGSPLLDDERGFKTLNIFKPGGVEPMKPEGERQERELTMFLCLIDSLVTDATEREWIHDTFSTIFQKTGEKIRHFNLFYSPHFQNGKSSTFKTIRKGLGSNNCSVIGPVQAIDREKPFLADKMLVLVDELKIKGDFRNKIEVVNLLKPFATETQHDVRPLFKGWREVHSTCNFMMATNHKDAVALPKNEARYTVIKVHKTREQIGGTKFFDEFHDGLDLLEKTGGTLANVVKWYYLNRTISSNFRQQGPCLTTPALLQMSEDAGHPMFVEMKRMFKEGDKPFSRAIFGVSEAWEHCKTNEKIRGQLNEFVDNLLALGCQPYGECKHKRSGLKPSLYSCRSHDFFQGMTKADIANKYWLPLDLKDGDQGPGRYNMSKTDINMVVDKIKEIKQWEEENNIDEAEE